MKNIFCLVIDAFCYNILNHKIANETVTPFLKKLSTESIVINEMFAQAPYTEAALVSLLSGENTLDSGGYMLGNGTVKQTIFDAMRKKGFYTISQYSPYVYSVGYLKGVDEFWYTRLFNFDILYTYRLSYFSQKKASTGLSEKDQEICCLLLEESFETWMEQVRKLLAKDKECTLILPWVDLANISKIQTELKSEYVAFCENKLLYLFALFQSGKEHNLLKISKRYNVRKKLENQQYLIEKYEGGLKEYQKKYSKAISKKTIDLAYVFSVARSEQNGIKSARDLLYNYKQYYQNKWLEIYLSDIDEYAKTEVSMQMQLDYAFEKCKEVNRSGHSAFTFIQVQDFHLPTVFHSVDCSNQEILKEEFEQAFLLLDRLDEEYEGNIIADLSANYIDNKIKEFYSKLQAEDIEFELVITADHGFPSLYKPPRPMIYNQTYTEAFHIPFIYFNGKDKKQLSGLYSAQDLLLILTHPEEFIENNKARDYILCEYAGPGCPDISCKPIWYTYIDEQWRVSLECKLDEDIDFDKVKAVYNRKSDPKETRNLIKNRNCNISDVLSIIEKRHVFLRMNYKKL